MCAATTLRRDGSPPFLEALHRRTGRSVVVLVDEYDKPILDALDEPERATANLDDLRAALYGTLKSL